MLGIHLLYTLCMCLHYIYTYVYIYIYTHAHISCHCPVAGTRGADRAAGWHSKKAHPSKPWAVHAVRGGVSGETRATGHWKS